MIQQATKRISKATTKRLTSLQTSVDGKNPFDKKVAKAQSLWDAKKQSKVGKKAFGEITTKLTLMCVSVEVCNFCEQNEANDIEHVYPKSFFPGSTFKWTNYLLACKQCNTAYKSDNCYVIDSRGNPQKLVRGTQPVWSKVAFVNPRREDPNVFFTLNLESFKFKIIKPINSIEYHKADKTLEVLELNTRPKLIEGRKSAAKYYFERLEKIVKIIEARDKRRIKSLLSPFDTKVDFTLTLPDIKEALTTGFKLDIQTHQHPSVWEAFKLQHIAYPEIDDLFNRFPEALTW